MKAQKNFSTPTISVIISMYNVENYIAECLQSLLNQTVQSFEVIVIDDRSTDNSVDIVEKMKSDFGGRLNLIKLKKNSGCAGIPRNFGLKSARGEYIYFLDSDDFIDKTAFENLYRTAKYFNADVVHCEKYFECIEIDGEFKDNLTTWLVENISDKPTLETDDIEKRVKKFTDKQYLWNTWGKLFRRKFLEENKIQFSDMTSFEDMIFSFCCIVCAKNYVLAPYEHYHYRIRNNSLSHKTLDINGFMRNVIEGIKNLDNFMVSQKFFAENPESRFSVIDFFAQERIDIFSENIMLKHMNEPGKIYSLFCKDIFSRKPQENISLTSYFFILLNIYRIILQDQHNQIEQLKNQLEEYQN